MNRTLFHVVSLALGLAACSPAPAPQPEPLKTNLTLEIFNPQTVKFAAYQDGNGAWKPLEGSGAIRTVSVVDRFGLAIVCPNGDYPNVVRIRYYTLADLPEKKLFEDCFPLSSGASQAIAPFTEFSPQSPRSLQPRASQRLESGVLQGQTTFSVALNLQGIPTGRRTDYGIGYSSGSVESGATSIQVSRNVERSPIDLVAMYRTGKNWDDPIEKVMALRDYVVTENRSETLDFSASSGITLTKRPLNVVGTSALDSIDGFSYFDMKNGPYLLMDRLKSAPFAFNTFPSDFMRSGDRYYVDLFANRASASQSRGILGQFEQLGSSAFNFAFLDPFDGPTGQVASTTNYVRTTLNWTAYPGASSYGFAQYNSTLKKEMSASMSATFAQGLSSYTFPDLSAVANWNSNWVSQKGESVGWTVTARTSEPLYSKYTQKYGSLNP